MRLEHYMSEYSASHQNRTNIKIHQICVPAILWSVLGFLDTLYIHNGITAAHVFTIAILVFYATLKNIKVFMVMLAACVFSFATFAFIPQLRIVTVVVFVLAWIGQFYGHKVEGKKPSFFKDLFFLLIGPIWVFKKWIPSLTN